MSGLPKEGPVAVVDVLDALDEARAMVDCAEMATERMDPIEGRPLSEVLVRASDQIREAADALARVKGDCAPVSPETP